MRKQTYIRLTSDNLEYINKLSKETGLTRNAIINEIIHTSKLRYLGTKDVNIKDTVRTLSEQEKQK